MLLKGYSIGRGICLSISPLLLSACAEFTHLTRTNIAPGAQLETTYIDAKQRAITTQLSERVTTKENGKKSVEYKYSVCAEPSPDALSAIAASQGLSLSKEDIQLAVNSAIGESAGSIGLRTQSIQLMRDSMYRLCEAKLSGALSELAFETLHRRFQSSMVAILAIEQLTGAVRPPAVVLGAEATSGNAEQVSQLTTLTEQERAKYISAQKDTESENKKLEDARSELTTQSEAADKAKGADGQPLSDDQKKERLKPYTDNVSSLEESVREKQKNEDGRKEALDRVNRARVAALTGGGSTEVSFQIEDSNQTKLNDASIQKVADVVGGIVEDTLKLSFSRELCTTILVAAARGELDLQKGRLPRENNDPNPQDDVRSRLLNEVDEADKERLALQSREDRLKREIFKLEDTEYRTDEQEQLLRALIGDLDEVRLNMRIADANSQQAYRRLEYLDQQRDASGAGRVVNGCNEYLQTTVIALQRYEDRLSSESASFRRFSASIADAIAADPSILKDKDWLSEMSKFARNMQGPASEAAEEVDEPGLILPD